MVGTKHNFNVMWRSSAILDEEAQLRDVFLQVGTLPPSLEGRAQGERLLEKES